MDELLREVEADPSTLGLVLHGSRASGVGRPDSDFDLVRVVTEEEYERRAVHEKRDNTDVILQTPTRLRRLADERGWWTASFLSAEVLVDKTGEIEGLVRAIVDKANEAAYAAVPEAYDGYLNSWVRSLKAWRRDDELGGRLHAAQSAVYLLQALFGLEHRWLPYLDRLEPELPAIERAQGLGGRLPSRRCAAAPGLRRAGVPAGARGSGRGANGRPRVRARVGRRSGAAQVRAAVARSRLRVTARVRAVPASARERASGGT
jgi:Nucleotidyltransferase domain